MDTPDLRSPTALAIIRAAKDLFLEDGYDGVNLDRVAQRAGVSRQTIYNRFGGKEPLFRAMVEWHWSFFRLEERFAVPDLDPTTQPPDVVLRRIAALVLRFLDDTEQVAFTRLVIGESRKLPWIAEEFYRLGKGPALAAFVEHLSQMHDAGTLDCPHPRIAAHQFLGLIQEFVIWPKVMAIGPALDELPASDLVVDEAIAMFLARYGVTGK